MSQGPVQPHAVPVPHRFIGLTLVAQRVCLCQGGDPGAKPRTVFVTSAVQEPGTCWGPTLHPPGLQHPSRHHCPCSQSRRDNHQTSLLWRGGIFTSRSWGVAWGHTPSRPASRHGSRGKTTEFLSPGPAKGTGCSGVWGTAEAEAGNLLRNKPAAPRLF